MQKLNHSLDHSIESKPKISEHYLNAIHSSLNYFLAIEKNLRDIVVEDKKRDILANTTEPHYLHKMNYIALLALEKLGICEPKQTQIDNMEKLILCSISKKPKKFQYF